MPVPHDPGPHWGEVGIHGLHRARGWDAVTVIDGPPLPEGRCVLVRLGDEIVADVDRDVAEALDLGVTLDAPYRAEAVLRPDGKWAIGATRITVVEIEPDPGGAEIELVWDGRARAVRIDGSPTFAGVAALERIGADNSRSPYVIHAHRLAGSAWEVELARL